MRVFEKGEMEQNKTVYLICFYLCDGERRLFICGHMHTHRIHRVHRRSLEGYPGNWFHALPDRADGEAWAADASKAGPVSCSHCPEVTFSSRATTKTAGRFQSNALCVTTPRRLIMKHFNPVKKFPYVIVLALETETIC